MKRGLIYSNTTKCNVLYRFRALTIAHSQAMINPSSEFSRSYFLPEWMYLSDFRKKAKYHLDYVSIVKGIERIYDRKCRYHLSH